jgi:hypothetical protein
MVMESLPSNMAVLRPPIDLFDRVLYTLAVVSPEAEPAFAPIAHDAEWEMYSLLQNAEQLLKHFPPSELVFVKALLSKRKALLVKHKLGKNALMCYVPSDAVASEAWESRRLIMEPPCPI